MKIDLHTHTLHSKDSLSRYQGIVDAVHRARLDGVAVTDHNELQGAFELREIAPFLVIPAEEIKTSQGEIIGLFLSERIEPGLEPLETIRHIRDQGGVVYVPHPFDEVRGSRITREALDQIRSEIDLLEVFNSRNALPRFNRHALEYARRYKLLAGAGSDAHTYGEYGHAYIDVPPFTNAAEFRSGLPQGTWHGRLSSPLVHLRTRFDRTLKLLS